MYEHQQISYLNVHHQCEKLKCVQRFVVSVSVSQWSVVVRAVPLDVNSTDALAKLSSSGSIFFLTVRSAVVVAPTRRLQQGVVWQRHGLVKQGVQSLLIDASFRKLHLGLLLLCGVDNGGAADLGQLATLTVKGPAADLISNHIFNEEDTAVKAERQPVEQLDVLQKVVVRVTGVGVLIIASVVHQLHHRLGRGLDEPLFFLTGGDHRYNTQGLLFIALQGILTKLH